ncbi:MAG: transglycosylase SLT domain-containing protein, partial [Deltaproteobacteria bacterium]|nr:transglycosylase SLT domain-containing protein [Deltaproteobacteria bacterium]
AAVPATPAAPQPAPLSEAMAVPYFTSGDAGAGATAFALEKWGEALDAFGKARAAARGDEAPRLDLLLGLTHAKRKEWGKAAERLAAAQAGLPQLADYVTFHLARAQYHAKLPAALANAQKVDRGSIVGAEADLLVGDLLVDAGDAAKVADHYRDYLKRRPEGPRRSEARFRLAEASQKSGGDPAEWVELYRRIFIDDPLSSWATKAKDRLKASGRSGWDKLTPPEQIAQARELFDAMRNPQSEAAYDAALQDPAITVEDRCVAAYHKAQSRFKERDRKGAAPMFDDAAAACKAAKNVDLEIKSNYQAARSYSFFGQHDKAIELYRRAQTIDPKHSYSDDALLREGEEWQYKGDGKQVDATLSQLPTKFPDGDNLAEAMWRLGFRAWREKRYPDAIKWWSKQIELVPHDDNWYGEGQAQYWLGRAYGATKKPAESLAWFEKCVRQYPAAYYALLSLNRIKELDAKKYAALVAELAADPKDYDAKAPSFTFKPRLEWGEPGFLRALELLRLGLGDASEAELRKLKLTAPKDRKKLEDADQIDKLWAIAYLFDRAGRYEPSHWPTRWHILDYRRAWPTGANRAKWKIAYPKGYGELLARHAEINKVPFAMQIAIVREESAFDPLLESYANAVGLTQMIPPTATDFSKGTGIAPTRENLRDPEKNVTIGSRFLGFLYRDFKQFELLVPPGYNAGPTGTRRMLRARGTWDSDEFVEGIIDDQARNYTKRVLGTYFTYSWLYEGRVPEIPNRIPKELLPK